MVPCYCLLTIDFSNETLCLADCLQFALQLRLMIQVLPKAGILALMTLNSDLRFTIYSSGS